MSRNPVAPWAQTSDGVPSPAATASPRRLGGRGGSGRVVIIVAALAMAGCSSSSPATGSASDIGSAPTAQVRTVDLGGDEPLTVGGSDLKIAYFTAPSINAYAQSLNGAAVDEAKKLGVELTTFESSFDGVEQVNQAETALASKEFNAWSVGPLSPQMCAVVKKAIAAGIVVSIWNQQICVPVTTTGEETWFPGTVNFVGGDQTADVFEDWLREIATLNPGKQKMILVQGPPTVAQTTFLNNALSAVEQINPDMAIVTAQVPSYDLAGAREVVQTLLPANPDVTVLASAYSDMTQGAVLALEAASRDDVTVYDAGGSTWAFDAVKSGQIELTTVFRPATESAVSIQSLYSTWYEGEPGPRYVDILEDLDNPFVTRENISQLQPEY